MRADLGMEAGEAVAERGLELADQVGLAVERAARQHKHRMRIGLLDLFLERLGEGLAVDHALHRRKAISAGHHREASSTPVVRGTMLRGMLRGCKYRMRPRFQPVRQTPGYRPSPRVKPVGKRPTV